MNKLISGFYGKWNDFIRYHFLIKRKRRDNDVCIVCNNCVGAMMAHDLGLEFLSPTVNLWMSPQDYIKLIKGLPDI